MNYPKISIITPSFNQGQFLEDTIVSVLGQMYPNLEYIIMDGGSEDNSIEIIKKYEDQITYWQSKKDKGQAAAINDGFLKATGDILMWLNSDDMLMPNTLYFIAQQYQNNGDGIYFGNCIHFEQLNTGNIRASGSEVFLNHKSTPLTLVDYIIQPSSFWSNKVWESIGSLNTSYNYVFDWDWFLRAYQKEIKFHALSKTLSIYRIHKEHKSGNGGLERQKEIQTIYGNYAPQYSSLYHNICKEQLYSKNYFKKVVALFSIFDKSVKIEAKLLRKLKSRKYKRFSITELHYIRKMM